MAEESTEVKSSSLAENSDVTAKSCPEHLREHQFRPGQSGNPGGRPKRTPVTDLYDEIMGDPEIVAELKEAIRKTLRSGKMAMVLQLKEMAERIEGKVTQPIDADLNVNMGLAERMAEARKRAARDADEHHAKNKGTKQP